MKGSTFLLFAYADANGNELRREDFYSCHPGIVSNLDELSSLEHDINTWCTLIMEHFLENEIEITPYTKQFIFQEGSKHYFLFEKFKIRYIKVFFKKRYPFVQIYDMKVA